MRTIEILSAVLAEDLISKGIVVHLDPEEIVWPDGNITKPPGNEKKGKGKKKKIQIANMECTGKLFMSMVSKAQSTKNS